MVWIVCGVVYVLSLLMTRFAITIIKADRSPNDDVSRADFLVTVGLILCPIINTIMGIVGISMLFKESSKITMNPRHILIRLVGLGSGKGLK